MNDRRGIFSMQLSLGNVLTIVSLAVTILSAFYRLSARVDLSDGRVGDLQSQVGELNARLDAMQGKP